MVASESAPVRGERSQPRQEQLPSAAVVEIDHRGIQMLPRNCCSAIAMSFRRRGRGACRDDAFRGAMARRSPPGLTRMLVSRLARAAAFATVLVMAW